LPDFRPGFVYILSNTSMKDLVKIGSTTRHPSLRAKELSKVSGVPSPFVVEAFYEVTDRVKAENAVQRALKDVRESPEREFFQIGEYAARVSVTKTIRPYRPTPPSWVAAGECPACYAPMPKEEWINVGLWDGISSTDRPGGSIIASQCEQCDCEACANVCGDFSTQTEFWYLRHSREPDQLLAELRRSISKLESLEEKANEGRCPACERPVVEIDHEVVTSARGDRTYTANCPSCGRRLRAKAEEKRQPWYLMWHLWDG